jgi:hypothetical protein
MSFSRIKFRPNESDPVMRRKAHKAMVRPPLAGPLTIASLTHSRLSGVGFLFEKESFYQRTPAPLRYHCATDGQDHFLVLWIIEG